MQDKTNKSNRVLECSENIYFGKFQFWPSQNHKNFVVGPMRHTIGFFTIYA